MNAKAQVILCHRHHNLDIEEVGTLSPAAEEEEPWQWPASTEAHFIGEERITPGNGGDA